ncbi:EpsG family protein [Marinobacter sp. NSM]|uniref:EpsG family protein n=1 Tax=Marinobacter sp. NSM TaxID=3458004 RepID=UPI004036D0F9
MVFYWIFFLIPLFVVLSGRRLNLESQRSAWIVVWFFLTLIIGLRHQVGGDWYNYVRHFQVYGTKSFFEILSGSDILYYLINWLVAKIEGSVHLINLLCAGIFSAGLVRFCKYQPLPWLALLVAIPYLVIVVAMGYTRQSVALGFLLIGLVSLKEAKVRAFVVWVLLGAAFHKSAVLMLPIAALASTNNRLWSFFWIAVITIIGGFFFLFDSVEKLWENYVESGYHSEGGLIRVLMNAVPALILFAFGRHMILAESEWKLWRWIAIFALVCIPLVLISSTATDRVALYLIPLQIFVFSRLPFVVADPRQRGLIVISVVGYYALVQAVWLLFASNAYAWLPYRSVLFSLSGD